MLIVHVHVSVKPEYIEAFKHATIANACASLHEPGIARFDLLQQHDQPSNFLLVEVYRTPGDALAHKQTPHYAAWRDAVAHMMAAPRTSVKFSNIFPHDNSC